MTSPKVIDAFMFHDEHDILQMRLEELYEAVDWFVLVESEVTHQDARKPSYYMDHRSRFEPWADKVINVWATDLPTVADDPDPWARELAQREWIAEGLRRIDGINGDDVILQSDVDEIPRAMYARNARPGRGFTGFHMRGHFWAVDWLYPPGWNGTVATTVGFLGSLNSPTPFGMMRNARNQCHIPAGFEDSGWHFSWLGGPDRAMHKVESFCHPEVEDRIVGAINSDNLYWREGFHVDEVRMEPVEVDDTWPAFINERRCPDTWWRPRD